MRERERGSICSILLLQCTVRLDGGHDDDRMYRARHDNILSSRCLLAGTSRQETLTSPAATIYWVRQDKTFTSFPSHHRSFTGPGRPSSSHTDLLVVILSELLTANPGDDECQDGHISPGAEVPWCPGHPVPQSWLAVLVVVVVVVGIF